MSFARKTATTPFRLWNLNGTLQWRTYKNSTLTFSTTTGVVTSITLEGTTDSYSATVGTVEGATWTGEAQSVTLTCTVNSRITSVTVTTGEATGVSAPVISGTTPFNETSEVTITCATENASIYYTLDGTTPTSESTAYTAPFTISESCSVKAIAYAGTKASTVVQKDFVKNEGVTVATVAALNALADDTEFTFTAPVTALGQQGKYLYVQDATAGTLLYGTAGQTYTMGNVIPAGWTGKKVTYNGAPEITNMANMQAATSTVEVTPKEIKTTEAGLSNFSEYVLIKNAVVNATAKTLTTDDGSVAFYNRFTSSVTVPTDGGTYNVYAVVGYYNAVQVYPVKFEAVGTPEPPTVTEVATVAELNALDDNTNFKFTGSLIATGQQGKNLYAQDETAGTLLYGTIDQTYVLGNVIPAGWTGTKVTYAGAPEITNMADMAAASATVSVVPADLFPGSIGLDNFSIYGTIEEATIGSVIVSDTKTNYYAICDGDSILLYNRFSSTVTIPTEGKYNITGIVGYYNGAQFYPTNFEEVVEPETEITFDIDQSTYNAETDSYEEVANVTVTVTNMPEDAVAVVYSVQDREESGAPMVKEEEWAELPADGKISLYSSSILTVVVKGANDEDLAGAEIEVKITHKATGIDDINVNSTKVYKTIENGQVIIVKGDVRYNTMGQSIK